MPIGWKVITMTSTLQTLRLEAAEQVYKVFSVYSLKVWLYIFKWSSYLFIYIPIYSFLHLTSFSSFTSGQRNEDKLDIVSLIQGIRFFRKCPMEAWNAKPVLVTPGTRLKSKTSQEWCKNSVHWTCTWLANNSASAPIKRQGWRGRVLVPGWFARAQTAGSLLDAEDFPWRRIQ